MMDALQPKDGWKWHAEQETLHTYIDHALEAFSRLESIPLPADSFAIEPSHISFAREGWLAFDDSTVETLTQRAEDFLPRLSSEKQTAARQMLAHVARLYELSVEPHAPRELVFCHHDVRQDNLAWHPDYGSTLIDWSWAGAGEPGSDATSLLIDLHKSGFDVAAYEEHINSRHCLTLMGFWLAHSTWPYRTDDTLRFEQFASAVSAYELFEKIDDSLTITD